VVRGGSWASNPDGCRHADRSNQSPGAGTNIVGFRVVRTAAP
jgi:formylglycine-generating enzyme required for sulfatase activity